MKQRTVVVVDDEAGFLQIVQVVLQRAGYKVILVDNGPEGLEVIQRVRPDIAIIDDNMPHLTGVEICRRLKSDPTHQSTGVILYSAGARIEDPDLMHRIGVDGVLAKPFMPNDLLQKLDNYFSAQASV